VNPNNALRNVRHLAGALGVGALIVLSATSIHNGLTIGTTQSVQAKGGGSPTGNATAPAKPPQMRFGQTAGEEPITTTTAPAR
jgi:hypothetical protein